METEINSEDKLKQSRTLLSNCRFLQAKKKLIKINLDNLDGHADLLEYLTIYSEYYIIDENYDSAEFYNELIAESFEERNIQNYYAPYYKNKYVIDARKYNKTSNIYFSYSLKYYDQKDSEIIQLMLYKIDRLTDINEIDSAKYYFDLSRKIWSERFSYDTLKYLDIELFRSFFEYYFFNPKDANEILEENIKPILFSHNGESAFEYRKLKYHRFSSFIDQYYGELNSSIYHSSEYARIATMFTTSQYHRIALAYEDIALAHQLQDHVSDYLLNIDLAIQYYLKIPKKNHKAYYHLIKKNRVLGNYKLVNYYADLYLLTAPNDTTNSLLNDRSEVKQLKIFSLFKLDSLETAKDYIKLSFSDNSVHNYEQKNVNLTLPFIGGMDSYFNKNGDYGNINMDSLYEEVYSYEKKNRNLTHILPNIWMSNLRYRIRSNLINDSTELLLKKIQNKTTLYFQENNQIPPVSKLKTERSLNSLFGQFYHARFELTKNFDFLKLSKDYFIKSTENHYKIKSFNESLQKKLVYQELESDYIFDEKLIDIFFKLYVKSNSENLLIELIEYFELNRSSIDNYRVARQKIIENNEKLISFLKHEKELKLQIAELKTKTNYLKSLLSKSNKSLYEKLVEKENELYLLLNDIKANFDFEVLKDEDFINYKELFRFLDYSEIIIYFDFRKACTYSLVISPTKTEFLKLDPLPDTLVQQFRNSLDPATANSFAEENYQNYVQSAYAIYKSQLKLVLDKFPDAKKIFVIPDGQLHHIPFEALISELPTDGIVNYKKLKYLINDYTFSYANSATTLFKTKSLLNKLKPPGQNILAFAPSYKISNSSLTSENIEKRPLSSLRGELTNLQWNSEEVNNIKQQFEGQFLINEEATEAQFKEQASKHDILHLSMHAVVDHEDPMYSYLAFAPDPQDTSSRDGFLHAFEIYDMDLNAEMAVLSACNTGYGKLYKGEGPMSLAKAFTYAGCPSVVMSHWPADDKSSSEIMGLFYENLAAGMKKDEALRKAKLDFLASAPPFRQAPAYWNNFVVMGDVSPIVKDQTQVYLLAMLAVVLFFALVWLLLSLLFRKKKVSLVS